MGMETEDNELHTWEGLIWHEREYNLPRKTRKRRKHNLLGCSKDLAHLLGFGSGVGTPATAWISNLVVAFPPHPHMTRPALVLTYDSMALKFGRWL